MSIVKGNKKGYVVLRNDAMDSFICHVFQEDSPFPKYLNECLYLSKSEKIFHFTGMYV